MKHTRLFARAIAVIAVVATLLSSALVLFACNKKYDMSDVFKSDTSAAEFTGYKKEFTLPNGWEVYTSSSTSSSGASNQNSDVGYIKSENAFVVRHTESSSLSIVKCGDSRVYVTGYPEGMLFPLEIGITALRVKNGLVICKFSNGDLGAFDMNGNTVISRTKLGGTTTNINIDTAISILDSRLIAVHATYDRSGVSGYTSIYRPTYTGDLTERGELVCRVANSSNTLSYVKGFDGKYVSVVGNSSGAGMFRIPDSANGNPSDMSATTRGTVVGEGQSNYSSEITYIGKGRFFVHEDWTVDSTADFTYYDGKSYYKVSRHIYTPDNDKLADYTANSDKVFLYLTNNYYDSDKAGIDTNDYLNDGFTYASYGLFIENKIAYYDQFILDSNLNVVMSLTGNYGIRISDQQREKVGIYDLIMMQTDGYYYVPLAPSELNVYDKSGKRVAHNDRGDIIQQELSNNVIVAAIRNPDDSDEYLFGAFDITGKEIIPFEYLSLSAFRGAYTIGERLVKENDRFTAEDGVNVGDKILVIIGVDGKEIRLVSDNSKPLSDIATTGKSNGNKPIYKIGCYMYKATFDGTTYYGIKNYNPNTEQNKVMDATLPSGSILYAPANSARDVFVFEKLTNDKNVTYTIYRLI